MKRKILVINSNSNPAVTDVIRKGLAPYVEVGTALSFATAESGPQGIDTELDIAVSGVETAKIVAANRGGYDGYIVACGVDPGLDVCRQIVDEPVVGIAEAAMLMACLVGYKFSVLTNLDSGIPHMEQLVSHYGLTKRLASVRAIGMSTAELAGRDKLFRMLCEAARKAVRYDRAEVIVLTGSVMVGMETRMPDKIGVPVTIGAISALKMVESLIDSGLKTSRANMYRPVKKRDRLVGYETFQNVYGVNHKTQRRR